ncbi:hypothetical protein PsAD5_01806 [Pseudovibrio sp. Ad5]|nr:hypothetical protein PsAD5_01806 [Pseudovibrio sp. Ad5]
MVTASGELPLICEVILAEVLGDNQFCRLSSLVFSPGKPVLELKELVA